MSRSDGFVYATGAAARHSSEIDVLVDYTSAPSVKDNVWTAVRAGVHVVVGSSGLTSSDYEELDRLARDHGVGVVAAGNFSIMAAVLRRAAAMAAQHLDQWEIIDYASASKPDVPSGTARDANHPDKPRTLPTAVGRHLGGHHHGLLGDSAAAAADDGQPQAIPSTEPDGVGSGRRSIRNELNSPISPARTGTSSAT